MTSIPTSREQGAQGLYGTSNAYTYLYQGEGITVIHNGEDEYYW